MCYTTLHCIALHCIALHCIALHCIALHCIASHCIALHRIALHCIALHCIALHCITLHYITPPNTGRSDPRCSPLSRAAPPRQRLTHTPHCPLRSLVRGLVAATDRGTRRATPRTALAHPPRRAAPPRASYSPQATTQLLARLADGHAALERSLASIAAEQARAAGEQVGASLSDARPTPRRRLLFPRCEAARR